MSKATGVPQADGDGGAGVTRGYLNRLGLTKKAGSFSTLFSSLVFRAGCSDQVLLLA